MALMLAFGAGTAVVNKNVNVPLLAAAESNETLTSGAFSYKVLEDDTITITDFDNSMTEVDIPAEIDGKPVTAIGNKAFFKSGITSVNIPDSIKSIGDSVFFQCEQLVSVSIPYGVESIGGEAFYECRNLTSIDIPDSVTKMGGYCFDYCTKLESARLSENLALLPSRAFRNTAIKKIVIPDEAQSIGTEAFMDCKYLESVSIGKNVQKIYDNAFWNCKLLTSVTIPENVTYMGWSVLSGCENLKELIIMNPICNITSNSNISKNCIIYGYEGSKAQEYADENGYSFEIIGSSSTIKGDLNNNGTVNIADILIMNKFLMGQEVNIADWKTADINDDGAVDVFDLCLMKKILTE